MHGALEEEGGSGSGAGSGAGGDREGGESDAALQRHLLNQRELFLSRQVETLPATHIRGKCSVTLLNETESPESYTGRENCFFYSLVYDPQQKTLLADKGEIRVGGKYQADMSVATLRPPGEPDPRRSEDLETLVWTPNHDLPDRQIDQFMVIARSVGTFARALDCSSSVKQPSLHMSAAAASRDITLFHAMDVLHKNGYDMSRALASLVPSSGPVLCRDEMEEWSASEANLFEEALEKYGKDFNDVRQDFLPWKSNAQLVEYYYMWKTTDRYVQQKRVKAVEAESRLKQVYIPNYNKPNPAALSNGKMVNGAGGPDSGRPCSGCSETHSPQWYSWGAAHLGGPALRRLLGPLEKEFRQRGQLIRHAANAHGLLLPGTGSTRPVTRTRPSFFLAPTPMTRLSRRLCRHLIKPRPRRAHAHPRHQRGRHTRRVQLMSERSEEELQALLQARCKPRDRGTAAAIGPKLGHQLQHPEWMVPAPGPAPQPDRVAFPKPPKAPDGSLIYTPVESKIQLNSSVTLMRKRPYEETNGIDVSISKRPRDSVSITPIPAPTAAPPPAAPRSGNHVNGGGRAKIAAVTRLGGGRQKVIPLADAPDDVFHVANANTKRMRRRLTPPELRRAARKPWRRLAVTM
ncbi:Metastasis-associated protein MTA1 [Amphibalanus amphitrite]|uniref:Metastasis-associated protein MTA1 n=1 Tax=Amphibalanus amphitrite TaxID=1232801 RepID=A0A6A4VG58_AMPAM|nr:Metastasis-associated protein MTA1 [Amphibalanus amphitrite]